MIREPKLRRPLLTRLPQMMPLPRSPRLAAIDAAADDAPPLHLLKLLQCRPLPMTLRP